MIGKTISHYKIEAELGHGGMGVVYRAHDQRLRRKVALKLLPEAIGSHAERRARVLAEARSASALNHPGITTIYEVGEHDEQVFIVMELVPGRPLRAVIAEGALEPKAVVRLGAQVAEALAAAHAHGVVHRDIKPENIMVQPDGRVKLLDFGIAQLAHPETHTFTLTAGIPDPAAAGKIRGTLGYMAPEQWRGDKINAHADLFALGVG
jgi:serine/threonine protein kinase